MPLWATKVRKGQEKLQLEQLDSSENPDSVEMTYSWSHTPRLLTIFDFQKAKVLQICPYTASRTRQTPECVSREEEMGIHLSVINLNWF